VTTHEDEDVITDTGVKQVGAAEQPAEPPRATRRRNGEAAAAKAPRRPSFTLVAAVAVLGLIGTGVFAALWATAPSSTQQDPTVKAAATTFLTDFFNVSAKSVDANFNAVSAMATGAFSGQVDKFFNTAIRQDLQKALAESRGQIRALEVQSENAAQTRAAVYAVVDQVYVNNKITTPQADVVRLVINFTKVGSTWKISNVTVLEGASPASAGTPSGSAGSNVPGQ
jgi:hypothetical protein